MKTFTLLALLALLALALAIAACNRAPTEEITVVGNGTETCSKAEPCDGSGSADRRDPR